MLSSSVPIKVLSYNGAKHKLRRAFSKTICLVKIISMKLASVLANSFAKVVPFGEMFPEV